MKRLVLAICSVMLTGCASIPTSGPVTVLGNVIDEGAVDSVRVIVRPPSADMTPEEIIQGFISANASTANNYAVAREYMTARAASQWQPVETLVLDPVAADTQVLSESEINYSAILVGKLERHHRFNLSEAQQDIEMNFRVTNTNLGWRIDSAPPEALMSKRDFARNYRSATVYFLNDDFTRLVPEVVWVSRSESTTPTRLMRILLAGTGGLLGPSFRSAIPPSTELLIGAVTRLDGLITVDLNATALRVSESQRYAMLAQIVWTLTSPNSVSKVLVKAGGQELVVSNVSNLSRDMFKSLNPDRQPPANPVIYVRNGKLFGGSLEQGSVLGAMTNLQSLSLSRVGSLLGGIANGVAILSSTTEPSVREKVAQDVVAIDFDLKSRLWLVKSDGSVWIKDGANPIQEVLGIPKSYRVSGLANSPDGSRVAIIGSDGSEPHLNLFGVINSSTGVSLTARVRLEQEFTEVLDVSWASSTELLVLARVGVDQPIVRLLSINGTSSRSLGAPVGVRQVFSRYGLVPLAVTSQGTVWKLEDGAWQSLFRVTAINYAD